MSVEFEELEIARWLLERGMDVDVPAAVDARGFGGHTALFGAVVLGQEKREEQRGTQRSYQPEQN